MQNAAAIQPKRLRPGMRKTKSERSESFVVDNYAGNSMQTKLLE